MTTTRSGYRKRELVALEQRHVDDLVRACSRRAPSGIRDAALISTLWASALRISEVAAITPKDVQIKKRLLTVRDEIGKRGAGGLVALDAESEARLTRWLQRRAQTLERGGISKRKANTLPIFCAITSGMAGAELSHNAVRQMLQRRARRARAAGSDVPANLHPHSFRHGCARAMDRSGFPLATISKQLRHSGPSVTDVYLRELRGESAFEQLTRRGDD